MEDQSGAVPMTPVVFKARNGYLAVSPEGSDLRIGVMGETPEDAEQRFQKAEERWRQILSERSAADTAGRREHFWLGDAAALAVEAHRGQTDKRGDPYILHVFRVAVSQETNRARILALLHDVVEDAGADVSVFPRHIQRGVKLLTRAPGETYVEYIERIRETGDPDVIAVKLADLRDNLRRGKGDPRFTSLCKRYESALRQLAREGERVS